MVVMKVYGGLGGQLYQYALAYKICKQFNEEMVLDLSVYATGKWPYFNLDKLNIEPYKVVCFSEKNKILRKISKIKRRIKYKGLRFFIEESPFTFYTYEKVANKNTYYDGYFSNYKYFNDIRDKITQMFTPNFQLSKEAQKYIDDMNNTNSVAIHFRRGDYVSIGCAIGIDYYLKAIDDIEKNGKQNVYFLFSNDIDYAMQEMKKYKKPLNIVPIYLPEGDNKDVEEFYVMTKCKNHIIANSTYSLWAAYLANHDNNVYAPKVKQWNEIIYPEGWKMFESSYQSEEK